MESDAGHVTYVNLDSKFQFKIDIQIKLQFKINYLSNIQIIHVHRTMEKRATTSLRVHQ